MKWVSCYFCPNPSDKSDFPATKDYRITGLYWYQWTTHTCAAQDLATRKLTTWQPIQTFSYQHQQAKHKITHSLTSSWRLWATVRSGDWQGEGSVTVITVVETFSPPDMASDPLLPSPEVSPVWHESVSSNTGQAAGAGAASPEEESASFTVSAASSNVWSLGFVTPSESPAWKQWYMTAGGKKRLDYQCIY